MADFTKLKKKKNHNHKIVGVMDTTETEKWSNNFNPIQLAITWCDCTAI